ncbi:MazG family protein [Anaeropeptidivorans aminofermentans]|jgi:tetrapyrrole methylase family protein/MazG family protein|uniref:MazG family protein n=1 Tax=Anaeropeptidivorans aminofermentans TaxID=2934315 RepID=UPI002024DC94|nr:MazG family protein [Anaeropeptidivorans aminofermentans]MBE6013550.1 MazG family protein [Lachnospiraceae bacterium]
MTEIENKKLRLPIDKDVKFNFHDIKDVLDVLLSENGCPWDKAQKREDLRKYILEESYEVIEAVNKGSEEALCEELGDVLFQVIFMAKLSENAGSFNIEDVIDQVCRKMITRHTHIFGDDTAVSSDDVLELWNKNKDIEKKYKSPVDKLKKIPKELPALIRAEKVLEKAEAEGLPVPNLEESQKVLSEIFESNFILSKIGEKQKLDTALLHMVNIFRYLELNAEFSLTNATETFINRFENIKE